MLHQVENIEQSKTLIKDRLRKPQQLLPEPDLNPTFDTRQHRYIHKLHIEKSKTLIKDS